MSKKNFKTFINPHNIPRTIYSSLEEISEIKIGELRRYNEEEMIEECKDVDAILSTILAPVTKQVIQNARKLKIIAQQGLGVDHIDIKAATEHKIFVTNTPVHHHTVAEHTLALMLSLAKQIPFMQNHVKRGGWRDEKYKTVELYGKTVGIIGLGRIGFWVARKLQGFGVNILVYDPYVPMVSTTEEMFKIMGIEIVDLETLLQKSDFITIHCALTPETRGIIGEKELKKMKNNAFLINAARGPIVDEKALHRALKEGWIAGAGLDVYEEEPLKPSDPLVSLENIVFTPHIAGVTRESLERVTLTAIEDTKRVLRGENPLYRVNFQLIKPTDTKKTVMKHEAIDR
jgi:D-3-phosphoglycerate dehydrogenase